MTNSTLKFSNSFPPKVERVNYLRLESKERANQREGTAKILRWDRTWYVNGKERPVPGSSKEDRVRAFVLLLDG